MDTFFYGKEKLWYSLGQLSEFSQHEYVDADLSELSGLTDIGYAYYPNECYVKYLYNDCE